MNTFKIVVIGDGGVGKTSWVEALQTQRFSGRYVPTLGSSLVTLKVSTSIGDISLELLDRAGQEKYQGVMDRASIDADGCVVMFDMSSKLTLKNVPVWKSLWNNRGPLVVCGNKMDISRMEIDPAREVIGISVRKHQNLWEPLQILLKDLTGTDLTLCNF